MTVVEDMKLMQAHEGLTVGQSVRHIAIHPGGNHQSCATFHEQTAEVGLGEKPMCVLTALRPGGEVTQTCFNPDNPVAISLKEVKGVELDFNKDGEPVSLIIKNPKLMGLDPSPEVHQNPSLVDPSQEVHQVENLCHCECKQKPVT